MITDFDDFCLYVYVLVDNLCQPQQFLRVVPMRALFLTGRMLSSLAIIALLLSCQSPPATAVPQALETPTQLPVEQTPVSPVVSDPDPVASETPSNALEPPTIPEQNWAVYRGANAYGAEYPPYEIRYDPSVWSLVDAQTLQPRLIHREIPDCYLRLDAGPIGARRFASVQLAGREWAMAIVQPSILLYATQYQTIAFLFGVGMPEAFSPISKSRCQVEAEEVMNTFSIVEGQPASPLSLY